MLIDVRLTPHRGAPQQAQAPRPRGPLVSRRSLLALAAGAAVAVAGCSSDPAPVPSSSSPPDPDEALAATVASDESQLIELYDATIAAFPALAAMITTIREEHAAHVEAVRPQGATPPTTTPSASTAPVVAGTQQVALANLIDAERRATGQRTQACEVAGSTHTARLLALIAASEAGHVEFLRRASS